MNPVVPRMGEKAFLLSESRNTYVFNVPANLNKLEVARMVAAQYEVSVVSVNIAVQKGKEVRFIRKGGRVNTGTRANVKKAYVRLKAGDSIPVFKAITDEIAEAEATKKGPRGTAK